MSPTQHINAIIKTEKIKIMIETTKEFKSFNDKKTLNKNCFLLNDKIIRVILDNSYSKAHIFIYIL